MKKIVFIILLTLCSQASEPIALFNGKDLTGWKLDVPSIDGQNNDKPSFVVRNGTLTSLGKPNGHLVTEKEYSNYTLHIEYRFPKKAGNSGVMIHSTTLRFLNEMFPRSIEVQLMSGNAGDLICIGEDITSHNGKTAPKNIGKTKTRIIKNLTDDSEKPVGEWNTMVIVVRDDKIRIHVNGNLVNSGLSPSVTKGKIAIQAEGTEIEFRKFDLVPNS